MILIVTNYADYGAEVDHIVETGKLADRHAKDLIGMGCEKVVAIVVSGKGALEACDAIEEIIKEKGRIRGKAQLEAQYDCTITFKRY